MSSRGYWPVGLVLGRLLIPPWAASGSGSPEPRQSGATLPPRALAHPDPPLRVAI